MIRQAWLAVVSSARSRARLAGAIHALSVLGLLLNDHVLKQETWVPSWATGKLSDFLGLIVAPLTLCALFQARSTGSRSEKPGVDATCKLACFALPVSVFVATELSQTAADHVAALVSLTGLSWRLWADPTDLAALVVLPAAWKLARWIHLGNLGLRRSRPLSRIPVLVGALACIASGMPQYSEYSGLAFLVNRLDEPLEVDVAELRGDFNCGARVRAEPGVLRHEDFVNTSRYVLDPDQVLPFESCEPVRVTVNGDTFGIQWDPSLVRRGIRDPISEEDLADEHQLVFVERTGDEPIGLRFGEGTEPLVLADLLAEPPTTECAQALLPRLEVSGLPSEPRFGQITDIRPLTGDCLSVTFAEPSTTPRDVILCVPESEFPFAAGDEVQLTASRIARTDSLLVFSLQTGSISRVSTPAAVEFTEAACAPVREACGAIWQPLDFVIGGVTLEPGRRQRITVPGFLPSDLYLVRAFRPIITHPSCGHGLDRAQSHFVELIEVRGLP